MKVFERVQCKQIVDCTAAPDNEEALDSAVTEVSREAGRRVPYLAQAWRDLGNALTRMRESQAVRMVCVA